MEEITAEEINKSYAGQEPGIQQDEGENLETVEGDLPETEEINEEEEA